MMMQRQQILVVEDDAAIRRGIVDSLTFAGYQAFEAATGDIGLSMATGRAFDLLLLDLVLPGAEGLKILREVRGIRPTQPVIILTARGSEDDRVAGLRMGADDYVVKPFGVKELLARVEAVLRRSPERPSTVTSAAIPSGIADFDRRELRFDDGGRVELSEREVELLRYLVAHAGRAISREELLTRVWQLSPKGLVTRTVDMHITRLREKLRDESSSPRVLVTVRGCGYSFVRPPEGAT